MPLENMKGVSTQGGYSASPGQKTSVEKVGSSAGAGGVTGSPIVMVPSSETNFLTKSQNMFFSDFGISDQKFQNSTAISIEKQIEATLESFQPVFEEAKINQDHSLSSKMPEPLAVFSFKKDDAKNIMSALYQAYLEDTCSQKFSERIFQIIRQNEPNFFDSLDKSINTEISSAESIISVLELIFSQIEQADNALISKSSNNNKFEQYYFKNIATALSAGGVDSQGRISDALGEIKNLFVFCAKDPTNSIENNAKSQTALITQILQLVYLSMHQGSTTMILGEKMIKIPEGFDTVAQQTIKKTENSKLLTLVSLSSAGKNNPCYLYGLPNLSETQPYTSLVDLSSLSNTKNIRKIAYLMNLVSNEMAVSVGLGRLEGTALGKRYSSVENFIGSSNIKNAHTETKIPNSLIDTLVVSEDGAVTSEVGLWSVEPGKKKVLLFDGNNFQPTQKLTNTTSIFLKSILKNPSDNKVNKILGLEQNIVNATGVFNEGTDFFNQLYLVDKKLTTLSPRGLFTKLLNTFASYLSYASASGPSYQVAKRELALLSMIAKTTNSSDPQDPGNIVKRYMLSCMARTAIAGIRPLETSVFLNAQSAAKSAKQNAEQADAYVKALEEQLNKLQKQVPPNQTLINAVLAQLDQAKKDQQTAASSATSAAAAAAKNGGLNFTNSTGLTPGKIKFSNNDKNLLSGLTEQQLLTDEFLFSFFDLTDSSSDNTSTGYEKISFTPQEALKQAYEISASSSIYGSSFLDAIAEVFVQAVLESEKILQEKTGQTGVISSFVTTDGLTKNLGLDGTTILGMMLEASCILSGMFISVKKTNTTNNQYSKNLLKEAKNEKSFQDSTRQLLKNSKIDLEISVAQFVNSAGDTIKAGSALGSLCKASETDNFNDFTLIKNGVEIVPVLSDTPVQTVISNETDDASIATFIEIMKDLADERNMPILCFNAAKSLILAAGDSMSGIIKTGKQLLGIEKQTPEIKDFVNFSKTNLGQDYFTAMNEFTFDATKKTFADLKQAWQSPSKRSPKLNQGTYNCISVIFPEVIAKKDSLALMTVALPTDYVKNSIQFNFSLKNDRFDTEKTSTLLLSIYKKPVLSQVDYEPLGYKFYVRPIFNEQSFSKFTGEAKQLPISLADIVNKCIIDTGKTGLKEKSQKLDSAGVQEVLENEVISFLFRKAFSVLSSADLFENNISYKNFEMRSEQSINLARKVADTYGLPTSTFDGIFTKSNESGTVLDRSALSNLSVDKFSDAATSVNIVKKFFSFGEAELFYDLFSTVYFMAGRLNEMIFVPTALDRTIGVLFSPAEFKKYENQNNLQNLKTDQSAAISVNTRCTIDSYSVEVNPSTPLENK